MAKRVLSLRLSLRSSVAESFLSSVRRRFPKLTVQLVAFEKVPNGRMLELLGQQTTMAFATRSLLAGKPEVDLLLRIAGTTQIEAALKEFGYRRAGKKVLVAIGEGRQLEKLERHCIEHMPGAKPLKKSRLSTRDLDKVELGALLNTRKN